MRPLKVYQVGFYPPPYGGVAVHIQRLHRYLTEKGWDSTVLDITGVPKAAPGVVVRNPFLLFFWLFKSRSILHYHADSPRYLVQMRVLRLRHEIVFSVHNERFMRRIDGLNGPLRSMFLRIIGSFSRVIVDNPECEGFFRERLGMERVSLIPEFIPAGPPDEGEQAELLPYRRKFKVLLGSNAFRLAFHEGVDLYGLDQLVELMGEIGEKYDAGFIFLLPQIGDPEYFKKVLDRIDRLGLKERFIIRCEALSNSSSLWNHCDAVIRATNTDGNSLSVHEGLDCGVPVIASDCVPRPRGVIMFKTRDLRDLVRVVSDTLDHLEDRKRALQALEKEDNAGKIEALYRTVTGGSR